MATSPTSCGISCATTASAVVMPSGIDTITAVAITTPSTNVWKASPTTTSDAALLCSWQSSVSWQCRQSTSFSSTKNVRMPPRSEPNTAGGASVSSASGSRPSSAAPSSVPTAYEISQGTSFLRSESPSTRKIDAMRTPPRLPSALRPMAATNGFTGAIIQEDGGRYSVLGDQGSGLGDRSSAPQTRAPPYCDAT